MKMIHSRNIILFFIFSSLMGGILLHSTDAQAGWKTKGVIFLGAWGVKKAISVKRIKSEAIEYATKNPEFAKKLIKSIDSFISDNGTSKAHSVKAKKYLEEVKSALAKVDKRQNSTPESRAGPNIPDVQKINNRYPINHKYAGETHPSGVKFNSKGFPDFSPFAKVTLKIKGMTGKSSDFTKANKIAGFKETPKGYVWHHVEDGVTLQLIESSIHQAARHTGGAAILRGVK